MTTKANFIAHIADTLQLSKRAAAQTLTVVVEKLKADLTANGTATLPGIGKLKVKTRNPRQGRNPRSGEHIQIPARKVLKLAPSRAVKDFIQE